MILSVLNVWKAACWVSDCNHSFLRKAHWKSSREFVDQPNVGFPSAAWAVDEGKVLDEPVFQGDDPDEGLCVEGLGRVVVEGEGLKTFKIEGEHAFEQRGAASSRHPRMTERE